MNALASTALVKYKSMMFALVPYKRKIFFSSSLAAFLFTMIARVIQFKKMKKKTLTKDQRKNLLRSKLFFRGVYNKVNIEITGNEGLKYSKTQMFLDKVLRQSQKNIFNQPADNTNHKEDKVFYCILNNYLNRK